MSYKRCLSGFAGHNGDGRQRVESRRSSRASIILWKVQHSYAEDGPTNPNTS